MKIEYHNLYTHFVFSTLHRLPLISENHRVRIEKYMTGIIKNNKSLLYSIYANPEHVHFIVSRSPDISDEELADLVAIGSEDFINNHNLCLEKFKWQASCSAFSVSKSGVDKVCKYILNQPKHHQKITFQEEYETFKKFYEKTISPKIRE
jgi:putative transposase